jgi:hypothetical protein
MKLTITLKKTFQESSYEPFSVELGMETDVNTTMEKEVIHKYKRMANTLQDTIEEIFIERAEKRK